MNKPAKTIIRREIPENSLSFTINTHPLLQRIYAARGISTNEELERSLTQLLPYQDLLGIELATDYLATAVMQQQHLLVIGDFDADGATSSAVAVSALRALGAQHVNFLVPNRFEYGYGLTPEIVAVAAQSNPAPDIIITVDNGIASHAGVAAAKALGIKVVVTDHHLPGDELPNADAIVNPCQHGDQFASKCLAGVGVIFYVMLALRSKLRELTWFSQQGIVEPNMAQFLDLVALGTVADLVPLDRNNRILVHQGLQRMRSGSARPGIRALIAVAGRVPERLAAMDLGFAIAPRLNAAGRLTDMSLGISCLLSEDYSQARKLALQLDGLNVERRAIERDMQQQAFAELKKIRILDSNQDQGKLPLGLCMFDESWHQGVIGLLASRVKDLLQRPVIIFAPGNDQELKGSARSVPGIHIRDILATIAARHPEVLEKFGGHAMAAGMTIARSAYPLFSQLFAEEVSCHLTENMLHGEIYSDGELNEKDFCLDVAEQLRAAGPWGQAFPEPIFDGRFRMLQQWLVGGKHLKCTLGVENSAKTLDAIAFNVDVERWPNHRLQHVHAVYRLDVNEYLGRRTVQLIVDYLEPA